MKSQHEEWRVGTAVQIGDDVFIVIGINRKMGTLGAVARYEFEAKSERDAAAKIKSAGAIEQTRG